MKPQVVPIRGENIARTMHLPMEPLVRCVARGFGGAAILAAAFAGIAFGQTVAPTPSQQANFCRHVLLQMAGIGRPTDETSRRQAAFVDRSGLAPSDASVLLSASASLAVAMAPINQQAAAIIALGPSATATDGENLTLFNQRAQQLLTNATAGLLSSLSADGVQRLSAIAAKQP
jgi:hypothetical protein